MPPIVLPDLEAERRVHALHTIAVLVYDGVTTSEIDEPVRQLANDLKADTMFVSASTSPITGVEPVRTVKHNLTVQDTKALDVDVLVVPGGLGWQRVAEDTVTMAWLVHVSARVKGVLAISTGSLLLASAGGLAGLEATGHWLARQQLSALGAEVRSDRTVQSNDSRIVTASGHNAALGAASLLAERIRWGPEADQNSGLLHD